MSPVKTAPAQLTSADADLRHQYLTEVLSVLYPDPCERGFDERPGTRLAEYLVIPDARRPKLLVPVTESRLTMARVAAAAVRRFAEPQGRVARLKRNAVVAALRTGTWPALLRDRIRISGGAGTDTIDAYLQNALALPLRISIHIGPARANRKPVLQLLTPTGRTLGFAKLGTGPLTRRLVRAETAALTALSHIAFEQVSVPKVLHAGQWRGHQVLVQSALPIWLPRSPLSPQRLSAAMVEVANAVGVSRGWLATSPYWADLRNRLGTLERAEGIALNEAARALIECRGDVPLRYGAWHGDWAPWNMACLDGELLVWDWERFTPGVPLGFDAIHYELQRQIQEGVEPRAAVESIVRQAAGLLAPFDVVPDGCEVTALLYLVDLAARYLTDRQAESGARLGVLGTWLLPVLIDRVRRLP
jgi:hypothetical protein